MNLNKRVRGWIIRILQRAYPAGLEEETIFKQLHEMGYELTKKELLQHLSYLVEDDFIQLLQFGKTSYQSVLNNKIYKLTTRGIDLFEETITDEGVEI